MFVVRLTYVTRRQWKVFVVSKRWEWKVFVVNEFHFNYNESGMAGVHRKL